MYSYGSGRKFIHELLIDTGSISLHLCRQCHCSIAAWRVKRQVKNPCSWFRADQAGLRRRNLLVDQSTTCPLVSVALTCTPDPTFLQFRFFWPRKCAGIRLEVQFIEPSLKTKGMVGPQELWRKI
ncbi:unnamed protein product [Soboliphyme baturini]|uniref:Uncharacterized protein n=1 Tax=Soboliphyme baturini TaxID=241478 RepID=A0A183J2N7_9BILA|nr:unnamed protein product [Soboliphyme baturini]